MTQFCGKARYDRSQEQLFAVNITLTPEGDLHREEVLALLFESVGHSGRTWTNCGFTMVNHG
jgi:secreted Zn-dependent insulinase-like peptidase